MKIIVAIVNYGMKNVEYAKRLIQEYHSMPFKVDIFVLSEAPKDYGEGVTVLVGLPSKDPWSLPFAHKNLFAKNADKYDVFIYTEDDTLIRTENILAFLQATEQLGKDLLPGFIRYELHPNGEKNYTDIHGPYHWISGSVGQSGEYTFAKLSNDHSACYILTQGQLRKAITSGGFLVPPHRGRYDLICTAGTDTYTQCGFTRVICISHIQEFEIHHLPNAYLNLSGLIANNGAGLKEDGYNSQIEALQEVIDKKRSDKELFITEKPLATPAWDKNYYEPCRQDIVRLISSDAKEILSVGCCGGLTETYLLERGKRITAIPLDSVIARLGEVQGVSVLPPNFEQAFNILDGRKFDAIIVIDILQHLANPVEILTKLEELLSIEGVLVGSVPNLNLIRRVCGRIHAKSNKWALLSSEFDKTNLNLTSYAVLDNWLKASHFNSREVRYEAYPSSPQLAKLAPYLPRKIVASNIVFAAKRTNS